MGILEHLETIRSGPKYIKEWQAEHPTVKFNLMGAQLRGANLSGICLKGANLRYADLRYADLSRSDFSDAEMDETSLTNAKLTKTDFHNANLARAHFNDTSLESTCFKEANLNRAVFIDTCFKNVDLTDANLSRAVVNRVIWVNTDLSSARGLESIKHSGPSSLSIDTLQRSHGKIPDVFLRGCGLSDEFISYIPSLFSGSAIDFYSCFISYSHEDKSFARRLHDALQGRGIRCWLDEHQILPGDNIYERIDHGIRVWDKVLLCASQHSLTSGWVDDELKHAFAKEKQLFKDRGCEVLSLIPLNLDGYLFSDWNHPKRNQVLERMAPDFTGWESDNAKFEEQFERVVKALQTNNTGREPEPPSKL